MRVRVKLMGDLRRHHPRRPEPLFYDLPDGSVVADLVQAIGIPPEEETIIGINGQLATPESALADGDEVTLVSPMAGG